MRLKKHYSRKCQSLIYLSETFTLFSDPEMSSCAQLNTPALTLYCKDIVTASTNSSHLFKTVVACWDHSHFNNKISPLQISHFFCANLTFLQCKSHISSVQISYLILQCKSHISPDLQICTGEMWDLHWRNVRFAQEKCTGEMWDLHWRNVRFHCVKFEEWSQQTTIVLSKWLELVLAEIELHVAAVLVLAFRVVGVVH